MAAWLKATWLVVIASCTMNDTVAAEVPYPRSIPQPAGSPPPAYEQLRIAAPDGLALIAYEWRPAQASPRQPVLLFVHGIGMHGQPYEAVATGFTARGIILVVLDVRGHGRSEGPPGELAEPDVLRKDLDAWIDALVKRHPQSPIFLMGDSMGGLIAAEYARTGGARLSGLILMVPAFGVNLARLMVPIGDVRAFLSTGRINIDSDDNLKVSTREPGFTKAKQSDPLATHEVKPIYLLRIARMSLNWPAGADQLRLPLLFCLAGQDKVVDNSLTKRVWKRSQTPTADKLLRVWDDAYHTLCWDPVAAEVVKEIADWTLERSR